MLHDFLSSQRDTLISRCRFQTAHPDGQNQNMDESYAAITIFLDQLIATLELEEAPRAPADGERIAAQMAQSAATHGEDLYALGFTIEQVVRNYGDLCQAITTLALEVQAPIGTSEFRTLNRCLDDGIANAVIAFSIRQGKTPDTVQIRQARHNARLDSIAAMNSHIQSVTMAVAAMRTGRVGLQGATGKVLDRSLEGLQQLVDQAFADAE